MAQNALRRWAVLVTAVPLAVEVVVLRWSLRALGSYGSERILRWELSALEFKSINRAVWVLLSRGCKGCVGAGNAHARQTRRVQTHTRGGMGGCVCHGVCRRLHGVCHGVCSPSTSTNTLVPRPPSATAIFPSSSRADIAAVSVFLSMREALASSSLANSAGA